MTTILSGAPDAPAYPHAADLDALQPRFDVLIDALSSQPFSAGALSKALAGGVNEAAAILRAIPIQEGRLLERGIGIIADLNPDLVVLTQNLRLPVTKTALELVEKNDPKHFRSLTLDADTGGRKTYTPDLIVVNRKTKLSYVIDVKRSLGSYEVSRINELKSRMLAAALVVPDLLYRDHHRLVAEEVQVVILNAENQRTDIAGGVWPLSDLDHLVEVSGAGKAIGMLRERFHARIDANWKLAHNSIRPTEVPARRCAPAGIADGNGNELCGAGEDPITEAPQPAGRGQIRVGFARIPRTGTG
ncbi:hypothetical protein FY133_18355 [Agrobacterium tumefaciens]|uniref:hypothetical protein n=1 Tax=Agrobacterium tumefaciens TaxID=358 RepID=UPI0021D12835|nr:hypothetical protein [Agrobacterium tumefaciens]UXS11597.1 hypothetical protein FY155_18270 [Agrobacterium tumefaciens]UXS18963.1 hypothetical protein FY154_18265 [Agrobacterium tumefaciens]UXT67603.1 hypothetical protein FY133_18355 [Agrobacterium tumefaciens]